MVRREHKRWNLEERGWNEGNQIGVVMKRTFSKAMDLSSQEIGEEKFWSMAGPCITPAFAK
jgi:hypothetical protein